MLLLVMTQILPFYIYHKPLDFILNGCRTATATATAVHNMIKYFLDLHKSVIKINFIHGDNTNVNHGIHKSIILYVL